MVHLYNTSIVCSFPVPVPPQADGRGVVARFLNFVIQFMVSTEATKSKLKTTDRQRLTWYGWQPAGRAAICRKASRDESSLSFSSGWLPLKEKRNYLLSKPHICLDKLAENGMVRAGPAGNTWWVPMGVPFRSSPNPPKLFLNLPGFVHRSSLSAWAGSGPFVPHHYPPFFEVEF